MDQYLKLVYAMNNVSQDLKGLENFAWQILQKDGLIVVLELELTQKIVMEHIRVNYLRSDSWA